jgi:hypothetical protein
MRLAEKLDWKGLICLLLFSTCFGQLRAHHVQKNNKHKKNCEPSWYYSQNYTRTHGQQNIKYRDKLRRGQLFVTMLVLHE